MDYKNGKIYIIRNYINDLVYVGSTTQSLSKRFSVHKASMKNKRKCNYEIYKAFEELEIENFYIELVEEYQCDNKEQLCKKEGEYIRKFDSYKNGYNMRIEGRSKNEYGKVYREEHKDQMKKYRDDNKDKKKEYDKEYSEENKEKIKEYKKEYRELNQEQIKQQKKEYYKVNQQKIKEKNNKKFDCECGGKYTFSNKTRHLKSKKHLKYIENL